MLAPGGPNIREENGLKEVQSVVVKTNEALLNWPGTFAKVAKQHPAAKESIALLKAEGLDADVLIGMLYYCTNTRSVQSLRRIRKWAGGMAQLMAETEESLKGTADQLEKNFEDFWLAAPTPWQVYSEPRMIAKLRSVASELPALYEHYKQLSSQRGESRDEEGLVRLCLYVEASTGRPHWSDIAYLLEVAYLAHRVREEWNEGKLRKIVLRYERTYPIYYRQLSNYIFEAHGQSQPAAPVTRSRRNRRQRTKKPSEPQGYSVLSGRKSS